MNRVCVNLLPKCYLTTTYGDIMGLFDRLFGKAKPAESDDYRQLVDASMEELRLKTAAHDAGWQLGKADWNVDQEAGLITFTRPGGIKAVCSVQIIGT
jgi:hypothetical protein